MEEVLANPNLQDDTMRELYEASLNGCVSTLNTLIQRDPLILTRVSRFPFSETPLHIASLLGHLEFCQVLLDRKPSLASEVDSEGRCPLHLGSAEGHTEVVKALLLTNPEICLTLDKDDKLPLHFAAMRGRMGAIAELTSARPDSIRKITDDGSVLHLCVRYNHLEALKFLVESVRGDDQFLAAKDTGGNTVLHLAVRRRQIKTIKYLLSLSEITAENALNSTGLTALHVLERCPRDFISLKIEQVLIEAGVQRSSDIVTTQQSQNIATEQQPTPSATIATAQQTSIANEAEPHQPSRWNRLENFMAKYLQYQGNWIDETRGQLMVVATVIATMTFQSTISPPGGVWQEDTVTGGYDCPNYGFCEAGTAIVGYVWSPDFLKFVFFNSISFFSSLCVVLVLVSGFPLKNKVIMWILTIAMTVSVTFMLLTYMWALGLMSPNHIYYKIRRLGYLLVGAWGIILVVVGFIQTTRLIFWVKNQMQPRSRGMSSTIAPVSENLPG